MTTVARIFQKVRMMTGRKSPTQLTDAEIGFQLNSIYQYEFPMQFRTYDFREEYEFITQPNIDVYDLPPNTYQSFEPTAYVAGYPTIFVEDRSLFHQMFPDIRGDYLLDQGDGGTAYSGTMASTPVLKGSVLVYGDTTFNTREAAVDNVNNPGFLYPVVNNLPAFTSPSIGTVNYDTGAVSVTFTNAVPSGNEVRIQYRQYNANRPTTVFYWDNQLTLRPVPDKAYEIRLIAYRLPSALDTSNPNATPFLTEWWQYLAYAIAKKIFENNKDLESANEMEGLMQEQLILMGRRQWHVLQSQRTATIYSSPYPGVNPGPYYGWFGQSW